MSGPCGGFTSIFEDRSGGSVGFLTDNVNKVYGCDAQTATLPRSLKTRTFASTHPFCSTAVKLAGLVPVSGVECRTGDGAWARARCVLGGPSVEADDFSISCGALFGAESWYTSCL